MLMLTQAGITGQRNAGVCVLVSLQRENNSAGPHNSKGLRSFLRVLDG